jgi:hypothetical protein
MTKKVKIILSPKAEEVYNYLVEESLLNKFENTILKAFIKKKELIKINTHYGDAISKDKIPKEYIKEYGVKNLFRVELPNYWRILYTLTNNENEIEIIAFVLDIVDHKKYNKIFGYKKR